MTAGNSLSENECFSRRKWTSTTLSSAAKNAAAMTYHGTTTGGVTGTCAPQEGDVQANGERRSAAR